MEYGWIVSSEDEVRAVLTNGALAVRPANERVPKAMQGTRLGLIFERLVRMNDGERHGSLRGSVEARLSGWDRERVHAVAAQAASRLAPKDVAAYTVAVMAGIADPEGALPWIHDFAAAIAGGASDAVIHRGIAATEHLIAALPPCGDPDEAANTLGLLFQAAAATARLIENRLHDRSEPPVLMTRRWASREVSIGGSIVREGDRVIVLLTTPQFHYGAGAHRCPGEDIANTIADAVAASRVTETST